MKIDIREGNKITNYIQVYAPCNDSYSEEEEDSFFGEYLDTINYQPDKENLCVMGDFNSRVVEWRTLWRKHLGPHSDHRTACNYNSNHVSEHNHITNTFSSNRATQIYTWYKWNINTYLK